MTAPRLPRSSTYQALPMRVVFGPGGAGGPTGRGGRARVDPRARDLLVAAPSRALGGALDPARALWDLAGRLGAPRSLRELGMTEGGVERIADPAVAGPYANPRPVTRDGVVALLGAAWAGEPPAPLPV